MQFEGFQSFSHFMKDMFSTAADEAKKDAEMTYEKVMEEYEKFFSLDEELAR